MRHSASCKLGEDILIDVIVKYVFLTESSGKIYYSHNSFTMANIPIASIFSKIDAIKFKLNLRIKMIIK